MVDCANGAAYHTAPPVFHELGAEVIAIGVEPNGKNINDHCGATAPAALIAKVKEVNADIGIALDGDQGNNVTSMGCYSVVHSLSEDLKKYINSI